MGCCCAVSEMGWQCMGAPTPDPLQVHPMSEDNLAYRTTANAEPYVEPGACVGQMVATW